MILYEPATIATNVRVPDVHSTWKGLEGLLPDIIERFDVPMDMAIDCGVWYGFSTAALANFFTRVIGVDTFKGDEHAGTPADLWESARRTMRGWPNVVLIEQDCVEYLKARIYTRVGLVHVDAMHDFATTYACGLAACKIAKVVLFHDTCSFDVVREAVDALAQTTGRAFHNYPEHCGLGILA